MVVRMLAEDQAGALSGVYAEIRARLGLSRVPNVFKAMAAISPDVLVQNWVVFRRTVLEGELPRTLKEMIGLIIARADGSRYALAFFATGLTRVSMAGSVVERLCQAGDSEELAVSARAVLRFAEAYRQDPDRCDTEPLTAVGLSEDHIQEVIDAVLVAIGISRFAEESGVPAD